MEGTPMDCLFAQIDFGELITVLRQYGPLVLVVAFFLWQGWCRENRMSARITKLEDDYKKILLPLVQKCTKVIAKNTVIMRRLEQALDERWTCKANCPPHQAGPTQQ
jgi:hypothetical protein